MTFNHVFISIKWSNGGNWDNLTSVGLIELSFGTGCINYLKGDSNPNDKYISSERAL